MRIQDYDVDSVWWSWGGKSPRKVSGKKTDRSVFSFQHSGDGCPVTHSNVLNFG